MMGVRTNLLIASVLLTCFYDDLHNAQGSDVEPLVVHVPNTVRHNVEIGGPPKVGRNVSIVGDEFVVDGTKLHILSGSLHYFRLPAAYWRDRLQKLKAAGLNAVCTYVEWSYHETEERQYRFEGDHDVAQFIRIAAEEGLYVLLRPGPYICAERDLGGLPYWLLGKYPNIRLRTTDPDFIRESKIWLEKLFERVGPLLYGNGGPIILVQVENEYGSYDNNREYKELSRDIMLSHVGNNALLYTTDGAYEPMFLDGAIDGVLTTIDFGAGTNVKLSFDTLRRYMPTGPLMNSEYYPGWLTHWGESLQQVATDRVISTLRTMLQYKININFYMFFGGTNFEFSSGANYNNQYLPDITSYDYDAPLSEAGDPTRKYMAIRQVLLQYQNISRPVPITSPKAAYGPVTLKSRLSLLGEGRIKLGRQYKDVSGPTLPTFEALRQRAGLVCYETALPPGDGLLRIDKPRDLVYVYVDGLRQGIISRMQKVFSLPLKAKHNSVLSLLVENQGRINFGKELHDYKGILSDVTFDNKILDGKWSVTGFPIEMINSTANVEYIAPSGVLFEGPVLYEGSFTLSSDEDPLDTFLDPTGWEKGYIWINGHNLGRYWPNMGPQVTLYVPGVWLNAAPQINIIHLLELERAPSELLVTFIDNPILNRTTY